MRASAARYWLGAVLFTAVLAGTCAAADSATCGAAPPAGFGDAPATLVGDGELRGAGPRQSCRIQGSRKLSWTDANGTARFACLLVPKGASELHPLPLVVWLHASLSNPGSISTTGLDKAFENADLTGDPARHGFLLLLPAGRKISHFYPPFDDQGSGWDNWYRELDRDSPALNVDVATLDHFITEVKAQGLVDSQRVYLSGWSNGAAMAQLYTLNTPGIAAAAVYSSPDPYRDVEDPCAQTPFATRQTPLMDIHNDCDIIGICQTGQRFHAELQTLFPALEQNPVIIDSRQQPTESCDASCATQKTYQPKALLRHLRWPTQRNEDFYKFLRDNPLP